jgi:hypothetical protein
MWYYDFLSSNNIDHSLVSYRNVYYVIFCYPSFFLILVSKQNLLTCSFFWIQNDNNLFFQFSKLKTKLFLWGIEHVTLKCMYICNWSLNYNLSPLVLLWFWIYFLKNILKPVLIHYWANNFMISEHFLLVSSIPIYNIILLWHFGIIQF